MTNMAAGVRRNNLGLVIFGKGAGGKPYKRYVILAYSGDGL